MGVESERHQQFADVRSHGEWFHYIDDLAKFIAEMDHPAAYLLDRPHLWAFTGGWGPVSTTSGGQKPFVPEGVGPEPRPPVDF